MRLLAVTRTVLLLVCLLSACKTDQAGADGTWPKPGSANATGASAVSGEFYYAGRTALNRDSDKLAIEQLLDLPETWTLRRATLDRLAASIPSFIAPSPTNAEIANLIRPLLDDVLDSESHAQAVRFSPKDGAQWFYGFHLSGERLENWQTNLWKAANLASAAGVHRVHNQGFSGWKLSLAKENAFVFGKIGSWAVLTLGKHLPGTNVSFIADLVKGVAYDKKKDAILELRLAKGTDWIDKGYLKDLRVSELTLSVHTQKVSLRSEAKLTFEKDRQWTVEPWLIPTNTIQEPLIAFTAIQGLSNWFAGQKIAQTLQFRAAPNQLFLWAQSHFMFSLYAAIHVPDSTNVLERFSKTVLPELKTNVAQRYGGEIEWSSNNFGAFWHGLPAMVPFIRPGAEADKDVVVAGLFEVRQAREAAPPPPELMAQVLSRTNLIYYDWEVSTPHLNQISQSARMISELQNRPSRPPERPSEKWLEAIAPKLENTITEATLTSPQEIMIVRRSVTGLSSLELVALARWVENSAFPRFTPDFWLEPKRVRRHP